MKYKLTIPGLLPGLNEYIDAERSHKGKYTAASMKRPAQNVIGYMIRTQLRGVRFTRPVVIRYLWIEPSRRRDKDNIAFAKKFIQDALVETGVLRNDGWSEIEGFTDNFALDPKNPRVEVTIEEMEGVKRNGKRKNLEPGPWGLLHRRHRRRDAAVPRGRCRAQEGGGGQGLQGPRHRIRQKRRKARSDPSAPSFSLFFMPRSALPGGA